MWKHKPQKYPLAYRRPFVTTERLIAICAVAITAFGFAQPQVLALAGLTFEQPSMLVRHGIDTTPTGSLAPADHSRDGAMIHGLAGTLKPLRTRD